MKSRDMAPVFVSKKGGRCGIMKTRQLGYERFEKDLESYGIVNY